MAMLRMLANDARVALGRVGSVPLKMSFPVNSLSVVQCFLLSVLALRCAIRISSLPIDVFLHDETDLS